MENLYEQVKEKLEKYGQQHLLKFYDKLTAEKQEELLNQIMNVDFENLCNLYQNINKEAENTREIRPIEYLDKYKIDSNTYEKLKKLGKEDLENGKLAVITMAGGQGTRLRT